MCYSSVWLVGKWDEEDNKDSEIVNFFFLGGWG